MTHRILPVLIVAGLGECLLYITVTSFPGDYKGITTNDIRSWRTVLHNGGENASLWQWTNSRVLGPSTLERYVPRSRCIACIRIAPGEAPFTESTYPCRESVPVSTFPLVGAHGSSAGCGEKRTDGEAITP